MPSAHANSSFNAVQGSLDVSALEQSKSTKGDANTPTTVQLKSSTIKETDLSPARFENAISAFTANGSEYFQRPSAGPETEDPNAYPNVYSMDDIHSGMIYSQTETGSTNVCEQYSASVRHKLIELEYVRFMELDTLEEDVNQILGHLANMYYELTRLKEVVLRRFCVDVTQRMPHSNNPEVGNFEPEQENCR